MRGASIDDQKNLAGFADHQPFEKLDENIGVYPARGKRGGLIKLLWFDGQGLCLFSKRLETGRSRSSPSMPSR
jgi:transposase